MFETKALKLESSLGFFIVSYKERANNVRIISPKTPSDTKNDNFFYIPLSDRHASKTLRTLFHAECNLLLIGGDEWYLSDV